MMASANDNPSSFKAAWRLLKTSTFRLAAIYLLLFAISVGAILGYVYWNTAVLLEQQTEDTIVAEVQGLAEQYQLRHVRGVLAAVRQRSFKDDNSLYLLTDRLGRRLAGNLPGLPVAALRQPGWIEFSVPVEGPRGIRQHSARAIFTELPGGFRLVVGRDVEERRKFARLIRNSLYWALGITVLLGVGGGLLMSRNFLRRVNSITATSNAIMQGDLAERMPIKGTGDELDQLSLNLNDMLDQIERLMAGMREVSSNVAHDLRSPLSRMRAKVENALRTDKKQDYKIALQETLSEADGLLNTFNALLSIARAEAGTAGEGLRNVKLAEIVEDLTDLYGPVIEEDGGQLTAVIPDNLMIKVDRHLLAQALSNLIDNALKYASGEKDQAPLQLKIEASETTDHAEIKVQDNGPGIPEADLERVTERFVRLDKSRTKPGNGLGLSLVSSVMKLHGGKLELSNGNPGLVATLRSPKKPASIKKLR